jgi:hypothetical protein
LNHTFRLLLCRGNLTYPPSHFSRHDHSTRSYMSSHLVYPETYDLCLGTSRRTHLFSVRNVFFSLHPVLWCSSYSESTSSSTLRFLRFLLHVVLSTSLLPQDFLISVLLDLFVRFGGLSLGTYRTLYVFGIVQNLINFVDVLLVFLFWERVVEKYISFDMYHDRKENKNVDTFIFVHLYVISQHCWCHFKSHDCSLKVHSCHKHKCCPTSDVSLPDKRISPIRGVVREREYYC